MTIIKIASIITRVLIVRKKVTSMPRPKAAKATLAMELFRLPGPGKNLRMLLPPI